MDFKKTTKVVFADDSDIHRFLLKHLIVQFASLELVCDAGNGDELLRMMEFQENIPDVAILDLHMPLLDGNLTAKELLRRFPTITIYGFTSSGDDMEKAAMLTHGFYKVYAKNQLKELLAEVSSQSY